MIFTRDLKLDISAHDIWVVTLKQYTQDAWHIKVTLTQDGEPFLTTQRNLSCNIKWVTNKKRHIFQSCDIQPDGTIDLVPKPACFLDAGIGKAELNLIDSRDGTYFASMPFYVSIVSSVYDESEIESSDEYSRFLEYISTVENIDSKINTLQALIDNVDGAIDYRLDQTLGDIISNSIDEDSDLSDIASIGAIKYYVENKQYTLPLASLDTMGGIKPVPKTEDMTQSVGVDEEGRLYTYPTSGVIKTRIVNEATNVTLGGVKANSKTDLDTTPVHIGNDSKLYVPGKYPSPGKLTFVGDINFVYDGSQDVKIPITLYKPSVPDTPSEGEGDTPVTPPVITQTYNSTLWYGNCTTDGDNPNKEVLVSTTDGDTFELKQGVLVCVRFSYAQESERPSLNVNGTGDITIVTSHSSTNATPSCAYNWDDGEVIAFVYDGTYWVAVSKAIATTQSYGVTRLNDTLTSPSITEAATANTVRQLADMIAEVEEMAKSSALSIGLSSEYIAISVDNTGADVSGSGINTVITVYYGDKIVTDEAELSFVEKNIVGNYDPVIGAYVVQEVNSSYGYVDITATYRGYTVMRRFSIAKVYNGINGDSGRGIISTLVEYCNSAQSEDPPIVGWDTEIPPANLDEPYLWVRTTYMYSDNTESYAYSVSTQGVQGQSSLNVVIDSSNGNIFRGKNINTILKCYVYYGAEDVTDRVKKFTWQKVNADGSIDENWSRETAGNLITLTHDDVWNRAKFTCTVEIDI